MSQINHAELMTHPKLINSEILQNLILSPSENGQSTWKSEKFKYKRFDLQYWCDDDDHKKSVAKHNENGSLCRSFMRLNGSCQPTEWQFISSHQTKKKNQVPLRKLKPSIKPIRCNQICAFFVILEILNCKRI